MSQDEDDGRSMRGCTSGRGTARPLARGAGPEHVIQALYVLPADGDDHGLASNGTIERSVAAAQSWLAGQTGGRRLRFTGGPVATVRLTESDQQIAAHREFVRDEVERLLGLAGYADPHRVYAVWYDGTSHVSCGGGAWPPELEGSVAALYLRGNYPTADGGRVDCSADLFTADGVTPELNEFKMLHEILHTLGIVSQSAPHHTLRGHVSDDPRDLMYAGPEPWRPAVLDEGHDDYFETGRIDLADLSHSAFLAPA
jgi:hypothetical protein